MCLQFSPSLIRYAVVTHDSNSIAGRVDGKARDPRCKDCMVHCGYDPSGALGVDGKSGDTWKNLKYNFGKKPEPYRAGANVLAINGVCTE